MVAVAAVAAVVVVVTVSHSIPLSIGACGSCEQSLNELHCGLVESSKGAGGRYEIFGTRGIDCVWIHCLRVEQSSVLEYHNNSLDIKRYAGDRKGNLHATTFGASLVDSGNFDSKPVRQNSTTTGQTDPA